jgi:hypothetical protein
MSREKPVVPPTPVLVTGATLDKRGPFKRERRRQLEVLGLFPPRIPLSKRLNVWPLAEVETVERAVAAGQSDDDIRALVRYLVDQRKAAVLKVAA